MGGGSRRTSRGGASSRPSRSTIPSLSASFATRTTRRASPISIARPRTQNPVFHDDARGGSAEWFEAFVDFWNGPGSWAGLPAPAKDGFLRVGRKVYFEVRSLLGDATPARAYAAVRAPVLLLTGEHSPVAAHRVVAILAAILPSARLETITGAGHMGPITHGDDVNARIVRHIAAR
jgi:pimeloyl-ACP methyl ester carboxylesterase